MTNNNIKVSVIIPVYNTEEYVRQAVNSIRGQTLCELEIILVNDGSTDGSLQILEELAAEDQRIHLFSQENQGLSMTRNIGLSHARGKYIYFMDSDDLLEKDALELCFLKSEKDNSDFVFFGAETIREHSPHAFSVSYHYTGIENRTYTGIEILELLLDTYQFNTPVWLSFIKKTYIDSISLSFYPNIIHEDQLYSMLLYINASTVSYIPRHFFHRRIRTNSIMTNRISWKNVIGYFTSFVELERFASDKDSHVKRVIKKHLCITLNAFIYNAHVMTVNEKLRLLKLCWQNSFMKYLQLKNLIKFILP